MEFLYSEELYYPIECSFLFMRKLSEGENPDENRMQMPITSLEFLRQSYGSSADLLAPFLAELTQITNYVYERISTSKETLSFYFGQAVSGANTIGGLICALLREGSSFQELLEQRRYSFIWKLLRHYFFMASILDDETESKAEVCSETELFDRLYKEDGTEELKLFVLRFYYHGAEYEMEVREILKEAEVLFKEAEALFLKNGTLFFQREKALKNIRSNLEAGGEEILRDRYHVRPDSEQILIAPSYLLFQSVGVQQLSFSPKNSNQAYMWIGVLVDEIQELTDHCEMSVDRLSTQLKLLGDKRRLEILQALRKHTLCGQELAELTGLTPATISHHMSALLNEGFVNIDKFGTKINYRLADNALRGFLTHLEKLLL